MLTDETKARLQKQIVEGEKDGGEHDLFPRILMESAESTEKHMKALAAKADDAKSRNKALAGQIEESAKQAETMAANAENRHNELAARIAEAENKAETRDNELAWRIEESANKAKSAAAETHAKMRKYIVILGGVLSLVIIIAVAVFGVMVTMGSE